MKRYLLLLLAALFMPICFSLAQENEDYDPIDEVLTASQNTLKAWTDALNNRDEEKLASLYASIVKYYQSYYTNEEVRNSHSRFFKKSPYFHQYCDEIEMDFANGCQARISFKKHVQTKENGPYQTYTAYLHFISDGETASIIGESDATTDANLAKKKSEDLEVDNDTPLDAVFCEANVGKSLFCSYWDLVENGEKEDGPLANFILISGFARSYIEGVIKKDYKGQKGTYSCGGYAAGGECQWPVIFTYNPATQEMHCIGAEE